MPTRSDRKPPRTGSTDASGSHTAAFDALGRLVRQGDDTLTYADHSNNPVATAAGLVFRDPAGEAVSSAQVGGTNATALLSDVHGDVTGAFATATGTLAGSTGYSPYGKVTAASGSTGPLGYQGEYTDPDTGQVNMHARWYDPDTGGFSSRDSWTLNPVPSINANRYGYGNGNPLLNTDPSGHDLCLWGVCAPRDVERGIRQAERYANSAGKAAKSGARWLARNPGKALRFAGKRALGPIGWAWEAYDLYQNRANTKTHWAPVREYNDYSTGPYRGAVVSPIRQNPGSSDLVRTGFWSGGGGGGGAGPSTCSFGCADFGPPPPPPPPQWPDLIKDALHTAAERPVTSAKTDTEHDEFVDDSFTKSLKELGFSAEDLAEYFKHFPDGSGFCAGGLLGLQCTGGGNLLDPDTGVAYCNPGAGWTPGNTCVPLPGLGGPSPAAGSCGVDTCDAAALAAGAKKLADDIHSRINPPFVAERFRTTAVTVARKADGSLVNIVSGAGKGLSKDQLGYIGSLGRSDIIVATNIAQAHAEETAVHFMALNGLTPVAGGVSRNACAPDGCEEFLGEVGAEMVGPVTLGTQAKIPGQSMYAWRNHEAWTNYLAAMGYR
ncbi:RHS repeat-associated core domain-containing protein [Streptomyces sp. NPDC086080]|uniref:RHS repeat-associated core domain-containing protein n=1 Tax=Streptomyces sp. NPDC086080 TaxID=3365748 RepID=UPI0037CD08A9